MPDDGSRIADAKSYEGEDKECSSAKRSESRRAGESIGKAANGHADAQAPNDREEDEDREKELKLLLKSINGGTARIPVFGAELSDLISAIRDEMKGPDNTRFLEEGSVVLDPLSCTVRSRLKGNSGDVVAKILQTSPKNFIVQVKHVSPQKNSRREVPTVFAGAYSRISSAIERLMGKSK